jgi:ribosomal protein S18 acetylase RimI-like enzyme
VPHSDTDPTVPTDAPHPALRAGDWPEPASRVDGVTVREARDRDHEAIAHLTVASYVGGGHIEPDDGYLEDLQDVATRSRLARVLVGEVQVDVAEGPEGIHGDAGARTAIAGSVVLTLPGMPLSETARAGELEFRMLAVDPRYQRRGVARALVRAAIDRAEQLEGIDAVVLTTMASMTGAHRLYESEGFIRTPERDWRLSDVGLEPTTEEDQLYWVFRRPVS